MQIEMLTIASFGSDFVVIGFEALDFLETSNFLVALLKIWAIDTMNAIQSLRGHRDCDLYRLFVRSKSVRSILKYHATILGRITIF